MAWNAAFACSPTLGTPITSEATLMAEGGKLPGHGVVESVRPGLVGWSGTRRVGRDSSGRRHRLVENVISYYW